MSERIYWNDGWMFTEKFDESLINGSMPNESMRSVRIPHTVKELPFHYCDEHAYQMISGYKKAFTPDAAWNGKIILLTFDGVAHVSEVYINGEKVGEHYCGYTAFTIDITEKIRFNAPNELVVKVNSEESVNVPPFGYVIDYMTYGGIYRDVYIDIKEPTYITDAFVSTKIAKDGVQSATITQVTVKNPKEGMKIRQWIKKSHYEDYSLLGVCVPVKEGKEVYSIRQNTGKVDLWDIDNPNLYCIKTEIVNDDKEVVDDNTVRFGYRKAVFHKDGFYLNGKRVLIRGLNRHQSYPYVGYAMPESMQKNDADILKYELGVNAVRTSHYPQSQYFIDRCDEIGLLVFTEIPGWQFLGDDEWKERAIKNVEDMIVQYRNHSSIILWGVRINESPDDDELYIRTNEVARKLDPTRQTGGVRCFKKGHLFEDVYTYNDFSHVGGNPGCEKKIMVTPDMNKPYLVTEYGGHMFPTKSFDCEEKRGEHALRHARVINDVAATNGLAGSFGWCMFDYNTHKDFGSGDRICYHGVMDMFRNPKLAAYVYAAQQEEIPVLEFSSSMDLGEHPGSNRGDNYIFSNADSVKMFKNGYLIKEYKAEDSQYKNLAHGPIRMDDYIGDAFEREEQMSPAKAAAVKELINALAAGGLYSLPKILYVKAAAVAARYHMSVNDAVQLYNKYIGDWGSTSTEYTFEAIKNDEVVKTLSIKPMSRVCLSAKADHNVLKEGNSYDVAAVRICAMDENSNVLRFCNDPVIFSVEGPIELIGPDIASLSGGMGGTYIRTTGKSGAARLKIEMPSGEQTVVEFTVE